MQTKAERDREFWFAIGKKTALAYLHRRNWLYRRVESIEFVGRGSAHRRVSVDFELPTNLLPGLEDRSTPGGRLVPISTFPKWPPLTDFDLIGPSGHPASLYLRDTNKFLDLGLLLGMAEIVCDPSTGLRDELALIISEDQPDSLLVAEVVRRLETELFTAIAGMTSPEARRVATQYAEETADLAGQMGNSSVLWVPVVGTRGTDCIVKFSYLDPYHVFTFDSHAQWKRLLIGCSWWQRTLDVWLPHAGLHTRYHLDVVPPGHSLEITSTQLIGLAGSGSPGSGQGSAPIGRGVDESVPEYSEPTDQRAVIYRGFRDAPSHRLVLRLRVAASREGFISGVTAAAAVLAVVMTAGFAGLRSADRNLDSTVVLLAAVPVVLGYVLVRPGLTAFERYHFGGVRVMGLVAGAIPIIGAFALVLGHHDKEAVSTNVREVWALLLVLSWAVMSGLALSWLYAIGPRSLGKRKEAISMAPGPQPSPRDRLLKKLRLQNRIAARNGVIFGVGIVVGTALANDSLASSSRTRVGHYLVHHRGIVLVGSVGVAVGAVMLYGVLARIWQIAAPPKTATLQRRVFRWSLIYTGVPWIWLAVLAAVMMSWLTLTVSAQGRFPRLGSLVPAVFVLVHIAPVPAAIFVLATGIRLLMRRDLVAEPRRRALAAICVAGILGFGLLTAHAVGWVWLGYVSPVVAAVGIAIFVVTLSAAVRVVERNPSGT